MEPRIRCHYVRELYHEPGRALPHYEGPALFRIEGESVACYVEPIIRPYARVSMFTLAHVFALS